MTKGEFLDEIGVGMRMTKKEADEEADEEYRDMMRKVIECFRKDTEEKDERRVQVV